MKKNRLWKNKIYIPEGHKPPVTRRDFLKYGVIPFAGTLSLPNFVTQILTRSVALAQESACAGGGTGYVPFLVFDMAGGAALPGNFLVGKQGGPEDLLGSYETLGWNPRSSGALDNSFGVPMAANNVSQILVGLRQTASENALRNLRMGTFCHFSQDDTSSNRTSALSLISRAGLQGRFIQSGVGSQNSLSGGNSDVALREAMFKPLFVQSVNDIQSSVSHGPAFSNMSDEDIRKLSRAIQEMSSIQLGQFEGLSDIDKLAALSECGYETTLAFGKTIQGLDPRQDQNASQVYQLNQRNEQNSVFASIAYNVLQGNTGPGAITIGDCDYHSPPAPPEKGQQKDLEMGQQIGRAVELAYRLRKPLFFQLITDGGVSALPGTRTWNSDSNVRSLTAIGYFNPDRAPEQRRFQVGEYTDGGTVNQNTLIGDEPSKVANAVLANYLSVSGKLGEFEKVAQIAFRNSDLDSVLIF